MNREQIIAEPGKGTKLICCKYCNLRIYSTRKSDHREECVGRIKRSERRLPKGSFRPAAMPKYLAVLKLSNDGMTYKEIASTLKTSIGTVKSRMFRINRAFENKK